ncbi:MAG: NAD(P)/FAD-dependent oxidoreductase [Clostridia bacterium]|nr:NAD(P)/FAD-dependent oxidoreductase [Clostridia bacterium]
MKNILIAGAGHGGLVAAIRFAKEGYRVRLYEKRRREELGYDWHDAVPRGLFEGAGLPEPPEGTFLPPERMAYFSTAKKIKLYPDVEPTFAMIDRKVLIEYLLSLAEKNGVELFFEREILAAAVEGDRVTGLRVRSDDGAETVSADLVVDAAGMDSPVRRSLPARFGIEKELKNSDIFYGWRGYFEKTGEGASDPPYIIYFFHCGKPGMDWMITGEDFMDVLVGGFGGLTQAQVDASVNDFKKEYPYMGDKLLRGGYFARIPLRGHAPLFVANGYAAVGDSAFMTEPLSGSGIGLSMGSGRRLADTVIAADGDSSVGILWQYNRDCIRKDAERYYFDLILKNFLSSLSAADIDFFFEKHIMTAKEMGERGGYSAKEILEKANVLRKPKLMPSLVSVAGKVASLGSVKAALPEEYDPQKVRAWTAKYNKVFR